MLWTNDQVSKATRILGKYSRVCDALPEIEKAVNRKVTASSLKHAMKQRGADAPSYYLQRDLVNFPDKHTFDIKDEVMLNINGIDFAGEAARKSENAWIRNVDKQVLDNLDHVIRPVDGINGPTFTPKTFAYDVEWKPNKEYFKTLYGDKNPVVVPPIPMTSIPDEFRIPGSYREVIFGEKITKIMVCPDAHHPFVDKTAWKVFLKACKVVQPDVLVIIGDFLDCLSISAHPKKARDEKLFSRELEAGNKALDEICALMIKRVVYVEGNHENRFSRYLNEKAPELDGLLQLNEKLKLKERGIEFVPYGEFIRIGEMAFSHDVGRCGVNAARQSLQDFGDNLTFGHSHRAQVVYGGTVEGKTHVCMNVGWLGDYDAIDYRNRPTAKREWQHSMGLIYQDKNGVSYCNLIPIIDGRCIIDGKLVDAN